MWAGCNDHEVHVDFENHNGELDDDDDEDDDVVDDDDDNDNDCNDDDDDDDDLRQLPTTAL